MEKEYLILLDHSLEITAEDLSKAWAEIPECSKAGEMLTGQAAQSRSSFGFDPASVAMGALIASGAGLAKDLIVLLVKRAVDRADGRKKTGKSNGVEVSTTTDAATGLPIIRVSHRSGAQG